MNEWLLILIVFSPIFGVVVLSFIPKNNEKQLKLFGILATLIPLVSTIYLYTRYIGGANLGGFKVFHEWFQLGNGGDGFSNLYSIPFEFGVDGFSLIMLMLTAILSTLAAIASIQIKKEWKGYFILFLLLELGMLGVFVSENLILFFLFFEVTLVSTFFLIGKWGYMEKEKAAYSFLIYNGLGSAILLFVIMVLFARTGTANIEILSQIMTIGGQTLLAPISTELKYVLLGGLLLAFGIKLPIFPLHTWMLRVHVQAPPAVVMLHAGVLLKIGAYGIIRFGMGIFPEEFKTISVWIAVLGVVNLLYGAFLAIIQTEFKLVLAYSSISHMGIVLIGLGAFNEAGIQGAIFQVVSHGLIAALLFFLVGLIYDRLQTTSLDQISGLAKEAPYMAGFLLAGGMASLGLPGLSGFVSEFMSFLGLFQTEPVLAAVGTLGIILTAVYILRAILGLTFGLPKEDGSLQDIKGLEYVPVVILMGLIIWVGIYPTILQHPLQEVISSIMNGMGR